MPFEKYTGARRTTRGAMVTIRKSGQIAFNATAASDMGLVDKAAVVLYYDRPAQLIGLRAENNPKAEGARKLGKVGRTRTVAASSYMNFYGISLKRNLKVVPVLDKKNNMIVLDLKKAIRAAVRARKKK